MSSTFAFVPRAVSKDKKKPVLIPQSIPTSGSSAPTTHEPNLNANEGKTKASGGTDRKTKYSDEDYANLICIAISDYALWSDPDLRRTVDWSSMSESGQQTNDGCT
jgi:hypothetical protein